MVFEEAMKKMCLNGWWNFQPVFDMNPKEEVPVKGWNEQKYMVPSFFTKPRDGIRKKGTKYYENHKKTNKVFDTEEYEFLFDAYEYPIQWNQTRSAWVKRTLKLEQKKIHKRYFLLLEAVEPRGTLFINGQKICKHIHPTLPLEVDITEELQEGENEIAILIQDYERDQYGRMLVPTGNWIVSDHAGVWQDVYLIERAEVYISDITIRTSTREQKVSLWIEVTNASKESREIVIAPQIYGWIKDKQKQEKGECLLDISSKKSKISPNATRVLGFEKIWKDAIWWEPHCPKLYECITKIEENNQILEIHQERFGFREVWIEGKDLILNDHPVHLFSDWGHKTTPYHHTQQWIRQWFGMIKDGNMNHSRLHTHPHPKIYLQLADEEGIMITAETGLHGSGGEQGADDEIYWQRAEDHVRRFVKRDKNHPSIVLWSVENEMRWNGMSVGGDQTSYTKENLPKLRKLFKNLDPTRPAYHEGDSSLWNEKNQEIISRHYGKECAGLGWWDQIQPLHSGEMCAYHYVGPNNTCHLGGDLVWSHYKQLDKGAALDTGYIIESGRTLGVCSFGPWNMSCLENLRMEKEKIELKYQDMEIPGVKPLYVQPHSSEFEFWKEGKGYHPYVSFDIQARAFRPLAVIDQSQKKNYFEGQSLQRTLFVVNDTEKEVLGTLKIILKDKDGYIFFQHEEKVHVSRGKTEEVTWVYEIPEIDKGIFCTYEVQLIQDEQILEQWSRMLEISSDFIKRGFSFSTDHKVSVYGKGEMKETLQGFSLDFEYVSTLEEVSVEQSPILVMEPNTVIPGSTQNRIIQQFLKDGGRVLLLEQQNSLFPEVTVEDKQVLTSFMRGYGHPLLEGLSEEEYQFWGEDPYPLLAGNSYVADRMYRKDDGKNMLPIFDTGEGSFGNGDFEYTPLFEIKEGKGLLIASQFKLTQKMDTEPGAQKLLINIIKRLLDYNIEPVQKVLVYEEHHKNQVEGILEEARKGAKVLLQSLTEEQIGLWKEALHIPLEGKKMELVYQGVRGKEDPILQGISNQDTCGIEAFTYAPGDKTNEPVGDYFLTPIKEVETLIETPTESALKELMVLGGRSEILKTHTLSRFLFDEKPEKAVILGRISVGKGELYFHQWDAKKMEKASFKRYYHRLLGNLGWDHQTSLLEGEKVPEKKGQSEGYPQNMWVLNRAVNHEEWEEMIHSIFPSMERMGTVPILNVPGWEKKENREGEWLFTELERDQDIYLYYQINSPIPRKNVMTNLGIPNPEALTFMDLYGHGEARVYVNGVDYGHVQVDNEATISDISLEKEYNHVLIQWKPKQSNDVLRMQWRNIMRQSEITFQFC